MDPNEPKRPNIHRSVGLGHEKWLNFETFEGYEPNLLSHLISIYYDYICGFYRIFRLRHATGCGNLFWMSGRVYLTGKDCDKITNEITWLRQAGNSQRLPRASA